MAEYAITAGTRRTVLSASAGTGPYQFTFPILVETDLAVYKNTTLQTLTSDYTVTINQSGTGFITLGSSPSGSDIITIVGARTIERSTDFVTAGDLLANSLNTELDSQTIFVQQVAEDAARAISAPVTDPASIDMTLPSKADRLGKYLQFNITTGNPEVGANAAEITTLAAVATDIATLADIEDGTDATDAIQTVASNATAVQTVNSNITSVTTVSSSISNINNVNSNLSAIATANSNASSVSTVASAITNVNNVGGSISNVNAVATDLAGDDTIGATAGAISNVNNVGGSISNVNTVAGAISNVNSVASDATDIGTVAAAISNVNLVASNINAGTINAINDFGSVADASLSSSTDYGSVG